jgi:hypothetical protein
VSYQYERLFDSNEFHYFSFSGEGNSGGEGSLGCSSGAVSGGTISGSFSGSVAGSSGGSGTSGGSDGFISGVLPGLGISDGLFCDFMFHSFMKKRNEVLK